MKRSIRWSLLGSYALTLVVVLALLGGMLYRQRRETAEEAVRRALEAHGRAIAGAIEWDEDGFELELDPAYLELFRSTAEDAPLFEVRGADGRVLYSPVSGREPAHPPSLQLPGPKQALWVAGTHGTRVWIRQGTHGLERELRDFRRNLVLVCLGALVLALLGGLVLVGRVLAPIRRISDTASRISASNPDERIDVERMETELASLATTLNEAFDRLQGALDRQVRFTADASHDLRTPLAVQKASLEWALRAERSPAQLQETLAACLRATNRMDRTVNDLLALARSDAGEGPPCREPLDLRVLADDTAEYLGPLAEDAGVALRVEGEAVTVPGDRARLAEAVGALLANALEHTPEGGRVAIRTGRVDGEVELEVADSGPGIAEADLPHLFERFYRADAARRGGGGLGLAIAKQIVEAHGGTITAGNRPDGGAVFRIRLPAPT